MTPFELVEPTSIGEAIRLLDPDDSSVRPVGGGTALMLMMKTGVFKPSRLVSLARIGDGLARIEAEGDGTLRIGAMTPLSVVERSVRIARCAPVIVRTMHRLANVRVRNVATVGGNLAHGDPHMDLPPVLIALGAHVAVAGADGNRALAVEELFTGYYETALRRDELITELRIPPLGKKRSAYLKVTTGSAEDWPALGVAVAFAIEKEKIVAPRVVVSAATEKATRLRTVEDLLAGKPPSEALFKRAGDAAVDEAEILSDSRGSAPYKRELMRVYLARALREATIDTGACQ